MPLVREALHAASVPETASRAAASLAAASRAALAEFGGFGCRKKALRLVPVGWSCQLYLAFLLISGLS